MSSAPSLTESSTKLHSIVGKDLINNILNEQLDNLKDNKTEYDNLINKINLINEFNIGGNNKIFEKIFLNNPKNLIIRPPLNCDDFTKLNLGENIFINNNCTILSKYGVDIGSHMWMAPNIHIYSELPEILKDEYKEYNNNNITDDNINNNNINNNNNNNCSNVDNINNNKLVKYYGKVEIGNDCWIGGGVKIFPGVKIGNGVVIGSGSIVLNDLPSNTICIGNPCKVYKSIDKITKSLREDIPKYAINMTERDKMLNGIPYMSNSEELIKLRNITDNSYIEFNKKGDNNLLEELFQQKLINVSIDYPFYTDYGMFIKLGSNVKIGNDCTFLSAGGIYIGNNVIIESSSQLYTATHPVNSIDRNSGIGLGLKIIIGNNCKICKGSIILPGITIGDNVIVLEGSVVTKDVPSGSIVSGNPARIIKQ